MDVVVVADEPQPQPEPKYTLELDFLEAWQVLNALIERRGRLRLWLNEGTEVIVLKRVEDRLRDLTGIHHMAPAEPWGGIEQYQSESR